VKARLRRRARDFDNAVDRALDRVRSPAADKLFYGASAVGDHGMLWVALAGLRYLRGPQHHRAAGRAVIGVIVESIIVNGGIKSLFRRRRPVLDADFVRPRHLRIPVTSSFPSGHATSAFTAATLLADGDPVVAPLLFAAAAVVATSRVYVKIHHATDVVGGVAVGLAMGRIGKRVYPLESSKRLGG
jgi:undecaprenyl-diphosphatase